ncbi:MAG: type IX secretion system sortase PorU [Dysgonamonadaceae bacterium]|nr:type IX secretion system sortase PorU [Dysgonamonadaceae bacterium]
MTKIFVAITLICVPLQCLTIENDGTRYAKSSVLAAGNIAKIKVTENAVYKLTYDDLKKFGFNDPAKVKIYGYGGHILNENFTKPYTDDLPEVPVYTSNNNKTFEPGDFLLFYGQGTVKWEYNEKQLAFEHEINPYSTAGYYFLKEDPEGPKKMNAKTNDNLTENTTLTAFDDYAVHERELKAISNTGRELFGESFAGNANSQQFTFSFPGITNETGKIKLSFAAAPKSALPVVLALNKDTIVKFDVPVVSSDNRKAYMREGVGSWEGEKTEQTTLTVSCQPALASIAHLNYITLNVRRELRFYPSGHTFFRNKESIAKPVKYVVNGASANCQIWDITGKHDVLRVEASLEGTTLSFSTKPDNTLHEYVMINPSYDFPSPELVGKVENQNLHALPQTDMVIIAPTPYLPYAAKLAERHRQESLRVEVVEESLVFNEFSSGAPDATAYRRFMKMFYDRAESEEQKPRYLLLYGDGVFENRHLTPDVSKLNPQNFLLTFQVKESLNELISYGTDDYFGFLDDSEGVNIASDGIDIGVGRLPVSNISQAGDAVNKILNYMDNSGHGNWKSKIIFTADNTDSYSSGDFCTHAKQADSLARYIDANHPQYMLYKYFMDAYKPVNTNGNTTYPAAKKEFLNTLNEGCFLLNYTGHGSISAWSSEDMLNIMDVRQMDYENLPLWITATCDFGWFDDVNTSAGEEAFLSGKSGAIALYTTSRVVYSQNNFNIHGRLLKYLFEKDVSGAYPRLGDVLRRSKVDLRSDANKLNYVLLGDPALRLNYPDYRVRVETVNGEDVSGDEVMSFRALDDVVVRGEVTDESGARVEDFSGRLESLVFDSRRRTESVMSDVDGNRFSYDSYPNRIFLGSTEVTGGEFEFSFTVPLDISYTSENGKMIFYSSGDGDGDAFGFFDRYSFAGTNGDVDNDGQGPQIRGMYLNSESFRDGDGVNSTPYFYVSVFDRDGINLSGVGIGHKAMISIDGNPLWTYEELNNFYSADDNYGGSIGFSIPELPAGEHSLLFRVWDIMNNFSEDSLHFTVVDGYRPSLVRLSAFGNPAVEGTRFVFGCDLPGTVLGVTVGVYDLSGRLVWEYQRDVSAGYGKDFSFDWDLRGTNGVRVAGGVYVYRATVRTSGGVETGAAKKLVILGR